MAKKYKPYDVMVFLFGVFFVVLGILAIINSFFYLEVASFLWLCYLSLILIGAGMIFRSSYLIVMQLNIVFIPLVFWNVDFFYQLFSKKSLYGITDYFFTGGLNSLGSFVSLQHIYILPLSVYIVYRLGVKDRRIWIASFIEVLIVFFASLFFSSASENANCVIVSCADFIRVSGIQYNLLWIVSMFVAIYLSNYFFVKFFCKGK